MNGRPSQIERPSAAIILVDGRTKDAVWRENPREKTMRGTIVLDRPIEYSILHNAKPIGPSMGFYTDREIPESVIDEFGRRFVYAGVAPRKCNGAFDVDALAAGEFIVRPGLIYRRVG